MRGEERCSQYVIVHILDGAKKERAAATKHISRTKKLTTKHAFRFKQFAQPLATVIQCPKTACASSLSSYLIALIVKATTLAITYRPIHATTL